MVGLGICGISVTGSCCGTATCFGTIESWVGTPACCVGPVGSRVRIIRQSEAHFEFQFVNIFKCVGLAGWCIESVKQSVESHRGYGVQSVTAPHNQEFQK